MIHEIYLTVKKIYPENSDCQNCFLTACSLFFFSSENGLNYEAVIKFRPFGGLIGIHDSSLDKILKYSKILHLHAILPDAAGFADKAYNTSHSYCYMLPWNCISSLIV